MGKARDAQLIGDPDAERASSGCQPRRRQSGLLAERTITATLALICNEVSNGISTADDYCPLR